MTRALIIFAGRAGDRNPRAMAGAGILGRYIANDLNLSVLQVGVAASPLCALYDVELRAARADLLVLSDVLRDMLGKGPAIVCLPRCAAALATLPVVAAARPAICVVWFDAHGDCNMPDHTTSGYLGGLVLTGAAGLWETGLGSGLSLPQVVLVGARDLDPFEKALIDDGTLTLIAPGPGLASRLKKAIDGRPCYVHVDCDVLEPGIVPSEYQVPGGLSVADLHDACLVIAEHELVGLEVAEYEATWRDGTPGDPDVLTRALVPLLRQLAAKSGG